MTVFRNARWLRFIAAVMLVASILAIGLHGPSMTAAAGTSVESCVTGHDDGSYPDHRHDNNLGTSCCSGMNLVCVTPPAMTTISIVVPTRAPMVRYAEVGPFSADLDTLDRPPKAHLAD